METKVNIHKLPHRSRQSSGRDPRLQEAVDFYFDAKDYETALSKFIALIDHGNDEAYLFAAYIYEEGGFGVEQDFEKAFFYYKKAAETFGAVEGYLGVARCYYFGKGADQDYDRALEYYSAVENQTDSAIAFLMLGKMYQRGEGVQRDFSRARDYYQRAANAGYVMGLVSLGQLEQEQGRHVRGWYLRIKAGLLAFAIALKDRQDQRLRGW